MQMVDNIDVGFVTMFSEECFVHFLKLVHEWRVDHQSSTRGSANMQHIEYNNPTTNTTSDTSTTRKLLKTVHH